jgi:DHA3 family macrolide efflux protein-like MFS transporter
MPSLSIYKGALTQKQYLKLIAANVINRFGDSIDAIAFSWMAYQITGSTTWMAIIFGFNALPSILLMPFAGAWVERFNKQKVMVIADLGRGILVAIAAILYLQGILNPYWLIAFSLSLSTLEAYRIPSGLGLVPTILEKEHYTTGMSLNASASQVSMLIGMALAGAIVAGLGVEGAMLIDALTFFGSGLLIAWIKAPAQVVNQAAKSTWHLIKEGFVYLREVNVIFILCLFGMLMNLLFTPMGVLQTPYVVDILHQEAYALSIMGLGSIAGSALGSFIFPMLNQKLSRQKLLSLGGIGIGIGFLGWAQISPQWSVPVIYTTLGILAVWTGIASGLLSTSVSVAFMHHVDKTYIARAGSIFNAMVTLSIPLASMILSAIAAAVPLLTIMTLYGIIAIALFVLISLAPSLKTL